MIEILYKPVNYTVQDNETRFAITFDYVHENDVKALLDADGVLRILGPGEYSVQNKFFNLLEPVVAGSKLTLYLESSFLLGL
jgi:hypothetical protein